MAPELFLKSPTTPASDTYSFGVMMWEMLTTSRAFDNVDRTQNPHATLPPPPESTLASLLTPLLTQCLDPNPSSRPTFAQIVEDLHLITSRLVLGQVFPSVPDLPLNYVHRSSAFNTAKTALLSLASPTTPPAPPLSTDPLPISGLCIQGMGGLGKSVLAAALARDEDVLRMFPGGVHWIEIKQAPNLTRLQHDLVGELGLPTPSFSDVSEGKQILTELFALPSQARSLLVLDDVWVTGHLLPFGVLGKGSAYLVTSRIRSLGAIINLVELELGTLDPSSSLELLARWTNTPVENLPPAAHKVVERCGKLPLALSMIGAMVRNMPSRSWQIVLHRLEDSPSLTSMPKEVMRSIGVSIKALTALRFRYYDLAVFPHDTSFTLAALEALWGALPYEPLDTADVSRLVEVFVENSLLQADERTGAFHLHDLQREYILAVAESSDGKLPSLHARLLQGYASRIPLAHGAVAWDQGPDEPYYLGHIVHHLVHANRKNDILSLLLSYRWIQKKICAGLGIEALAADYTVAASAFPEHATLFHEVRGALMLSAHAVLKRRDLLCFQLVARLLASPHAKALAPLLSEALAYLAPLPDAVYLPSSPLLERPGNALIRILFGHSEPVHALASTPSGKLLVSISPSHIMVWDTLSGLAVRSIPRSGHPLPQTSSAQAELPVSPHPIATLVNKVLAPELSSEAEVSLSRSRQNLQSIHTQSVHLVVADETRAFVAGSGLVLSAWNLSTGAPLGSIDKGEDVTAMDISPSGRVLVFALRSNFRIYVYALSPPRSPFAFSQTAVCVGHKGYVSGVALFPSPQFQLASCALDGSLRVWSCSTGEEEARISHTSSDVNAVTVSQSGEDVYYAAGATVTVWSLTDDSLRTLSPGSGSLGSARLISLELAPPHDAFVIAGTQHGSVAVWDLESGMCMQHLSGHRGRVLGLVAMPPDLLTNAGTHDDHASYGSVFTGSVDDKSIRHFQIERRKVDTATIQRIRHKEATTCLALATDGSYILTGSADRSVIVWSTERASSSALAGRRFRILDDHPAPVVALALTLDSKFVISASRTTLTVWNLKAARAVCSESLPPESVISSLDASNTRVVVGSTSGLISIYSLSDTGQLFLVHATPPDAPSPPPDRSSPSPSSPSPSSPPSSPSESAAAAAAGEHHTNAILSVAISPESRLVCAGYHDGSLGFFERTDIVTSSSSSSSSTDTQTKEESYARLVVAHDHTSPVTALCFSPEKSRLISGSSDMSIRVWEPGTGRLTGTFFLDAPVKCIAVIPWSSPDLVPRSVAPEPSYIIAVALENNMVTLHHSYHFTMLASYLFDASVNGMAATPSADLIITHDAGRTYHRLVRHYDQNNSHAALSLPFFDGNKPRPLPATGSSEDLDTLAQPQAAAPAAPAPSTVPAAASNPSATSATPTSSYYPRNLGSSPNNNNELRRVVRPIFLHLYCFRRGNKRVRMLPVAPDWRSLAHDCVYILDTGAVVYEFVGRSCTAKELTKALEFTTWLRRNERGGDLELVRILDTNKHHDGSSRTFWELLSAPGSQPPSLPDAPLDWADIDAALDASVSLYRIKDVPLLPSPPSENAAPPPPTGSAREMSSSYVFVNAGGLVLTENSSSSPNSSGKDHSSSHDEDNGSGGNGSVVLPPVLSLSLELEHLGSGPYPRSALMEHMSYLLILPYVAYVWVGAQSPVTVNMASQWVEASSDLPDRCLIVSSGNEPFLFKEAFVAWKLPRASSAPSRMTNIMTGSSSRAAKVARRVLESRARAAAEALAQEAENGGEGTSGGFGDGGGGDVVEDEDGWGSEGPAGRKRRTSAIMADDDLGGGVAADHRRLRVVVFENERCIYALPREYHGHFFSEDGCLVLETRGGGEEDGARRVRVFFWRGRDAPKKLFLQFKLKLNAGALEDIFGPEISRMIKTQTQEVVQGAAPDRRFLELFGGRVYVHHGHGRSRVPLPRNAILRVAPEYSMRAAREVRSGSAWGGDNAWNAMQLEPLSHVRAYAVRGLQGVNGQVYISGDEVPARASSLNSSFALVLVAAPVAHVWCGAGARPYERKGATVLAQSLPGVDRVEVVEEGEEGELWTVLGGQGWYPSSRLLRNPDRDEPALFQCSTAKGKFELREMMGRMPSVLERSSVYMLVAIPHVWLWIGSDVTSFEADEAREVAKAYAAEEELATTVLEIQAGKEPVAFWWLFRGWVPPKTNYDAQVGVDALGDSECTLSVTGHGLLRAVQDVWECVDCGYYDGMGVCGYCKGVCEGEGHRVEWVGRLPYVCARGR